MSLADTDAAARSWKRVRIVVNQEYEGQPMPILEKEDVAKWFRLAGADVVGDDAPDSDVTVTVQVDGTAMSRAYAPLAAGRGGPRYSGAEVHGTIDINEPNVSERMTFSGTVHPPMMTSERYPSAQDAPFREAILQPSAFPETMALLIRTCYGPDALLPALTAEDWHVRRGAAEAFGETRDARAVEPLIGIVQTDMDRRVREAAMEALGQIRDRRAVPALIDALRDAPWEVTRPGPATKAPARALQSITRKDFGTDADKWQAWWAQRQGRQAEPERPALVSARRVRITLDQQYNGRWAPILKKEDIAVWLRLADVAVVPDNAPGSDGQVHVKVRGTAVSSEYAGGARHYSGATVDGVITLTGPGGSRHGTFSSATDPPFMISKRYATPQDAPFAETLFQQNALSKKLALLMAECYGRDVLTRALQADRLSVRMGAAEAMAEIGDAATVEPLTTALHDADWHVRRTAADALARIKDARAVEPLLETLKDASPPVRAAGARALGEMGDRRAVAPLIGALGDRHDWARTAGAEALGRIGDPRAVAPLIAVLRDELASVRDAAAKALRQMDWQDSEASGPALRSLTTALKDDNATVRVAIANALAQTRDPHAVEPLLDALADADPQVRRAARGALKTILGKDLGDDPDRWGAWWQRNKDKTLRGR